MSSARISTPPSGRERKAARPPKRPPPGAPDEPPRARCHEPAPDALRHAVEQFNSGELFEQHETLETLWRDTAAPVRGLYHGILQVGVGLYHWTRGNHHGASVLLEEGIARLGPFRPRCQGVDVDALVRDATAARARLGELGPAGMGEVDPRALVRVRLV